MTRQYQIQKITGKPDWNKIEKAPIDQKLWLPCEQISAYAQLAYDDSRLYVRLHAEEPTIRAENTGMLDQPCQDSCLEFFFSAAEQDARYINIELNPSLCIYFGFGTGREDLMRILLPDGAKTLHAASERTPSGWDVTYELPFQLLRLIFPDFLSAAAENKIIKNKIRTEGWLTNNESQQSSPRQNEQEGFGHSGSVRGTGTHHRRGLSGRAWHMAG